MKHMFIIVTIVALMSRGVAQADPWKDESGKGRGGPGWARQGGERSDWARGRGVWDGHHKQKHEKHDKHKHKHDKHERDRDRYDFDAHDFSHPGFAPGGFAAPPVPYRDYGGYGHDGYGHDGYGHDGYGHGGHEHYGDGGASYPTPYIAPGGGYGLSGYGSGVYGHSGVYRDSSVYSPSYVVPYDASRPVRSGHGRIEFSWEER